MQNTYSLRYVEEKTSIPTVLVVDDDRDFCIELTNGLSLQAYRSLFVTRGAEALDILSRDDGIGILVIDMNMPEIHGMEVLRKLSLRSLARPIMIIAMTGMPTQATAIAAMRLGSVDFIQKPTDAFEISGSIDRILKSPNHSFRQVWNDGERPGKTIFEILDISIESQHSRSEHFEELHLNDPSWLMLMVLMRAHVSERQITTSCLYVGCRTPETTAKRKLEDLIDLDLVQRRPHVNDRRKTHVALTAKGVDKMWTVILEFTNRMGIRLV